MDAETQLAENFCCAKCHNRQAVARTAAISGGLPNLLGLSSDKYILVSCSLCGYTEIYNAQLICSLPEEEVAASKSSAPQRV